MLFMVQLCIHYLLNVIRHLYTTLLQFLMLGGMVTLKSSLRVT